MSPSNASKKTAARLQDRRGRRKLGQFLLEGERIVKLAVESRIELHAIWVDTTRVDLAAMYPTAEAVGRDELTAMASTATPPPILAIASIPPPPTGLDARRGALVLDAVQDPGNLGALVRTAQAYGLGGVVLGKGCVDPWSPKVVRGSMGAVLTMPVLECLSLSDWVADQARNGTRIFCAEASGGDALEEAMAPGPWMLILGSEAHGVSPNVSAIAHQRVTIPIDGAVGSLGVAAAGAILIHSLRSANCGVD